MKINSKLISEKVDYYIDMMLINECEEPDPNEVTNGEEPEEGEKQKQEIIDDIMEELELLNDDEDDLDSEKDLDDEDGGNTGDEEEDVDEGVGMDVAKKAAAEMLNKRKLANQAAARGYEVAKRSAKGFIA
jgi:hypothetical protein